MTINCKMVQFLPACLEQDIDAFARAQTLKLGFTSTKQVPTVPFRSHFLKLQTYIAQTKEQRHHLTEVIAWKLGSLTAVSHIYIF